MDRPPRAAARSMAVFLLAAMIPLLNAAPAAAARVKTIKITDASIVEGNTGQQNLNFKLTWSGSKGGPAPSVHYATSDDSATAGSDYTDSSGTANLTNGGCRCATVAVPVKGDTTTEVTETFFVDLSSPVNGAIADAQAIGTIYDNDGTPALVAMDNSANEAAGTLTFTVSLTNASASTITVDHATADGTATSADYTPTSGSLSFAPGETTKSVVVTITNEALSEDDETLTLNLSNPVNASIVDAQGVGTIANDDADPNASIADVAASEGAGVATFTVSLDAPSGRTTEVDFTSSDATALAGTDYTATSGTVTIAAGSTSGTFDIPVTSDALHEGDETFAITLSGEVNLTLTMTSAVGTITDDDPVPTLRAISRSASESAGTLVVTVSLSNPTIFDVTADWATSDLSATAAKDYTAASGSLSVPAGTTTTTVNLSLRGDLIDEPNETLRVSASNVLNATAGPAGTMTLLDDDKTPTTLTLRVVKKTTAIVAKGLLETAASGVKVRVTLQRKMGTRYVKVASKLVAVRSLGDRDHDGKNDAAYLASFARPAAGRYRFIAAFAGTSQLKRCRKIVSFTL